ncbi:MAG: cysteine desulfurase family protein [Sulfuricellaceae bacterium]|jgi:cysteine desulfurase
MNGPIYLDYNATTPLDPQVVAAMMPYLEGRFGNPSSGHAYGREAKAAVDAARHEVAALVGTAQDEVIFTGSATEANNLALLGTAGNNGERRHLVTSAVEHPSVMEPLRRLQREGWRVDFLPVDGQGQIRTDIALKAIGPQTALVSLMLANNETGVIQPVREIAALAHYHGALMHVDAAQAVGKIPVSMAELGTDLLTLAGHKFYAPKGVGGLVVRRGIQLRPLMYGAGHEHGLRPGTENVPHLVALGMAASLARETLGEETLRLAALRNRLFQRLASEVPGLALNGHAEQRLPNTLNVSFPAVGGAQLLEAAPEVAASTGAACHAGSHGTSGALAAMGLPNGRLLGAVRLSIGRFTTEGEVDRAAAALGKAWRKLAHESG